MISRICAHCGHPIVGRSDKKYCSDECRFNAHNQIKNENEKLLLGINKALRKNRSILKTLSPEGRTIVNKEVLDKLGFSFAYFTSFFVNRKKQIYYFSYDYGFTPSLKDGQRRVFIVKAPPYGRAVDPWNYLKNDEVNDQAS
jgi:hypothetical protein